MNAPSIPGLSRASWFVGALLVGLAGACSDPTQTPDAALDVAPDVTPDQLTQPDASDDAGDATDAPVDAPPTIPRCEWPDGGPPSSVIAMGRNNTLALCNFCHQDTAPGAGDFSGQDFPRPHSTAYGANLTPDPTTGIGMRSDEQILRAIRTGLAADGRRQLCEMVPFEELQLSDANMCAVLAYLRSLPPVHRAIPASTCSH